MRGAARIGGSGQASAGTARCPHTAPRLARQARAAPGPSAAATCGACTAPAGPGTPWQGLARPGEGAPPVRRAPGRPAGAQGGPGPARQRRAAPPQLWRLWQDSSDTPYPTQAGARLPRAAPLLAGQAREAVRVQRGRLGERQVDDALVAAQRGQLRHHLAQVARARHLRGRCPDPNSTPSTLAPCTAAVQLRRRLAQVARARRLRERGQAGLWGLECEQRRGCCAP